MDDFFDLLDAGVLLRVEQQAEGEAQLCFRAAPGVLTPARREVLKKLKPQIIEWLVPGVEYLPLSVGQQTLWLLHQANPEGAFYNMPLVARLRGELDREALARAFQFLEARHQALRTTFPILQGRALQAVSPDAVVELSRCDLSTLPAQEREKTVAKRVREEILRPFDLERGPLWRAELLHLGEREHILVVTLHHVIADGWTLRILFGDLQAFYGALAKNISMGADEILPPLTNAYSDFALWQRQWLETDSCREQIEYWQNELSDLPPLLKLPTDRPLPAQPAYRGALQTHQLPCELTEAVRALSREHNASLFMTLLAAFQIVLRQCAATREDSLDAEEQEVRIGAAVANRSHAGSENVAGLFVNTLVLRAGLTNAAQWDDSTFEELLARVRENALNAYSHQDAPIDTVINAVRQNDIQQQENKRPITARRQREKLFQILFILQNVPDMALQLAGLDVQFENVATETSRMSLSISIWEKPEGLHFSFEYDTDVFEAATISRLSSHFERVLEAVVAAPGRTLSQFPAWPRAGEIDLKAEYSAPHTPTSESPNPSEHAVEHLAPHDELEAQLAAIWRDLLRLECIGVRDDFFDLGGHSMLAVRLLDKVENLTGQKLTLALFFQAPTIEGQANILRREQALDSPSMVTLQALGENAPLFCIDGAVRYRALARHLLPEQPVYGLIPEAPTDGDWFAFTRVGERVAHYTREIQRVQPHGPYYLAGLSFGGLVAFGVAQNLRAAGERVALLALFDTYGPGYLTMSLRQRMGWHWKAWANLETEEKVSYLGRRIRSRWQRATARPTAEKPQPDAEAVAAGVEDEWQIDILKRALKPEERAALRAFARRTRRKPEQWNHDGRLLLFTAEDKPPEFLSADPLLGWGEIGARLEARTVPGDHVGILREPNVQVLAAHLQSAIRQARNESANTASGKS